MELLLVQFLVLAFTGALWWVARRDLKTRASQSPVPGTTDLEQLCATLEALVVDLERRADDAMQRVLEAEKRFQQMMPHTSTLVPSPEPAGSEPIAEEPVDARYVPVYELLAAGVTSPDEIVRRTGLGRGEVDLIISLRARRAL